MILFHYGHNHFRDRLQLCASPFQTQKEKSNEIGKIGLSIIGPLRIMTKSTEAEYCQLSWSEITSRLLGECPIALLLISI